MLAEDEDVVLALELDRDESLLVAVLGLDVLGVDDGALEDSLLI